MATLISDIARQQRRLLKLLRAERKRREAVVLGLAKAYAKCPPNNGTMRKARHDMLLRAAENLVGVEGEICEALDLTVDGVAELMKKGSNE